MSRHRYIALYKAKRVMQGLKLLYVPVYLAVYGWTVKLEATQLNKWHLTMARAWPPSTTVLMSKVQQTLDTERRGAWRG